MTDRASLSSSGLPSGIQGHIESIFQRYEELVGSLAPPIDAFVLAELAGADVVHEDHGMLGMTIRPRGRFVISLGRGSKLSGRDELSRRGRFTLAHEIGHVLIAATSFENKLPPRGVENLCNHIAEALLMPEGAISEEFLFRLHGEVTLQNLVSMSGRFEVSLEALARRLASLQILAGKWVVGWRYQKKKSERGGLLEARWLAADASERVEFEPCPAQGGGCALLAFRTGTAHQGEEALRIAGKTVVRVGEAAPAGSLSIIEVLRARHGAENVGHSLRASPKDESIPDG